jgi:hypothetical protein
MKLSLSLLLVLLTGFCSLSAQDRPDTLPKEAHLRPGSLNSERIQTKFGSYGIEVLQEDLFYRISDLYSERNGERITRTLAFVFYEEIEPGHPLYDEHGEVVAGGSIGAVFKQNGWEVIKSQHEILTMGGCFPSSQTALKRMHISEKDFIAVHSYQFSARRDLDTIPYAQIIEIHHPDFLTVEELKMIFMAEPFESKVQESYAREIMAGFFEFIDKNLQSTTAAEGR